MLLCVGCLAEQEEKVKKIEYGVCAQLAIVVRTVCVFTNVRLDISGHG